MPFLPYLAESKTYREITDTFAGYNHREKIADGEFYDTQNLSTSLYPLLTNRKRRGYVKDLFDPGGIMDKVYLAYVDEGTLYLNDRPTALTGMTRGEKQLVPFGAYIVIFPDGVYYNTANPDDYGDLKVTMPSELVKHTEEWNYYYYPYGGWLPGGNANRHFLEHPPETDDFYYCYITFSKDENADATEFQKAVEAFQKAGCVQIPPNKLQADYDAVQMLEGLDREWLITNRCTIIGVYYNANNSSSNNGNDTAALTPEIRDCIPSTGKGNETGIYNPIVGVHVVEYNGTGTDADYYLPPEVQADATLRATFRIDGIYVNGTKSTNWSYGVNGNIHFSSGNNPPAGTNNVRIGYYFGKHGFDAGILVAVPKKTNGATNENQDLQSADVPDMNYVIECKNRLWGCKYGTVDGESVNEIYACELGNFRNWKRFEGISTDPYAASVGSDGPWTGAINYLGYPTFFKEDRIHRVAVSAIGAHEITETVCDGVQPGSSKSVAVVNGLLYYKGNANVYIYQGGVAPTAISAPLGDVQYFDAVAGVFHDDYYISMRDGDENWSLFCYDSKRGLWIREDSLHAREFATVSEELYALTADKQIWALRGTTGQIEDHVDWHAESGVMYYQYPDKKYVSRFNFRLQMEKNARMRVMIEYDSSGRWEKQGEIINANSLRTVTLPIRPHRCDHLRIRMEGRGDVKIFSVARVLEIGSDY